MHGHAIGPVHILVNWHLNGSRERYANTPFNPLISATLTRMGYQRTKYPANSGCPISNGCFWVISEMARCTRFRAITLFTDLEFFMCNFCICGTGLKGCSITKMKPRPALIQGKSERNEQSVWKYMVTITKGATCEFSLLNNKMFRCIPPKRYVLLG